MLRLLSRLPLPLIVLLSLLGYGLLSQWFPLSPFYQQLPLADIRTFTPSLWAGAAYGVWLLTLYGLYALAYRRLSTRPSPLSFAPLAATAVLFSLPLLFTYPFNATDIYRYWLRGRVSGHYQANPYLVAPDQFSYDPYLPFAGEWANETTPYGPLWELLAGGIARLTTNDLWRGLLSFKLVGLLAFLLAGWLIWQLLATAVPQQRASYTLLWLWNPALLLIFVVNGHNDALMLVWLLWGGWWWQRGRATIGFGGLVLAALTKPIAVLLLPFAFVALWQRQPEPRARVTLLLTTAVTTLALFSLFFAPFGSPLPLLIRLLRESGSYPGFTPATLLLLLQQQFGALSQTDLQLVSTISRLLLLGWLTSLAWRLWHGRAFWPTAVDGLAGYLLTALAFRIWYAAWLLPGLLVTDLDDGARPYRLRLGLYFLLTTQLSVLIYGHLNAYAFGGHQLLSHLVGIPFTFALPFLLARRQVPFTAVSTAHTPH